MRIPMIALIVAMIPLLVQAQTATMKQIPPVPHIGDNTSKSVACYELDARQGWQRMPLSGREDAVLHLVGPGRALAMDVIAYPRLGDIGWSVDRARYKPVGFLGHTGSDAAALEPFAAYKYDKSGAFGAAIIRLPDGRTGPVIKAPQFLKIPSTQYIDMRINDSDASLGDNGGFLVLCAVG